MINRTALQLTLVALVASSGCGRGDSAQMAKADSLNRDLQLAPADTTAKISDQPVAGTASKTPAPAPTPKPAPPKPAPPKAEPKPAEAATRTLAAGTRFEGEAKDTISSRHIKPPYAFDAPLETAVVDQNGKVVIPAGAVLRIRLTEFYPAENKSQKDGVIKAILLKITIGDIVYHPVGTVDSISHLVVGRGVTGGDVAKAGGGAAAGAVIGGLIGHGKGALIGGLIGAGAGTAVAVETADRDVVIVPHSRVYITLTEPLTVDASHAPIR